MNHVSGYASAVELVELEEIALAEQIDGSSARLEEVGAGERELEMRLRRLDRVPPAEDIEERRRGVHVEGGRQRLQQLPEQRHHPVARLLRDRDQDRDRGLRVEQRDLLEPSRPVPTRTSG